MSTEDKLADLIGRLNELRDRAEAIPEGAPNLDLLADFADFAAELSNECRLECQRLSAEVQELRAALRKISGMKTMPDYKLNTFTLAAAHEIARAALKPETGK